MKGFIFGNLLLLGIIASASVFGQTYGLQPSAAPQSIAHPGNVSDQDIPEQPQQTQQMGIIQDIAKKASLYPGLDPAVLPPPDAELSVRQAAVECAVAQRIEQMGRERQMPGNIADSMFKTGSCSGKVLTFMLFARKRYPDCFPKISLEEGIATFVNWARLHDEQGASDYLTGMDAAFSEIVPCMKK